MSNQLGANPTSKTTWQKVMATYNFIGQHIKIVGLLDRLGTENISEMRTNTVIFFLIIAPLFGCKDRYQEGFDKGFADGFDQATNIQRTICLEEIEKAKSICESKNSSSPDYNFYSTEVCGGGGVNVGKKHYSGGKTGCVRVYDDGRVERY